MKTFIALIGCFLGILSFSNAAETIVKGEIQQFDGKLIKLGVYANFITYDIEWKSKVKIEKNSFQFKMDVEETTQVVLRIEDKETSLFLDPGRVYSIQLSFDEEANAGRAFDKFLDIAFPYPQANETNYLIKEFNTAYRKFFDKNFAKMMYKGAYAETKQFIAEKESKAAKQENRFVANYINYALANLKDINNESETKLFDTYLKSKPILYQQKEYFNFFSQYYRNDFQSLALKKKGVPLLKAIMMEESLKKSLDELMKLKGFSSVELAELYLMNGLFEVYHQRTVNQKSAIHLFRELEKKASNIDNQKIATNIIATLLKFEKAQKFEDFSLENAEGVKKSLADFKGKPIYLGFWSNSSIPSLRELKVIKVLYEKYKEKINFISINLDEDPQSMVAIKAKYKLDWTFLHFGNDFELRERYGIKTVPTYFLIDSEGQLIQPQAKSPVEIEKTLYELIPHSTVK